MERGTKVLFVPPALEPVSLAEAKAWARFTETAEDALFTTLIAIARAHVEELTGRALITQSWDYYLDAFPCGELAVPRPRLLTVTFLKYADPATGTMLTLDPTKYTVDAKREPARIVPSYGNSWPSPRAGIPNAVQLRFDAGYGAAASDVPEPLKQAIKVLVATLFAQREMVTTDAVLTEIPLAFWQLINQHRIWWI